jgi:uncharacterized protein (DUF488 family)
MTLEVYTLGYSGRNLIELMWIARALDAVIFDIRYSVWSYNPEFRQKRLAKALGERYRHVGDLGNINHYGGGEIQLVDYAAGRVQIEASERPVVLMCACRNAETCHRTTIANRLRAEGFTVIDL